MNRRTFIKGLVRVSPLVVVAPKVIFDMGKNIVWPIGFTDEILGEIGEIPVYWGISMVELILKDQLRDNKLMNDGADIFFKRNK